MTQKTIQDILEDLANKLLIDPLEMRMKDISQATQDIKNIIFEECEKVSQEYQRRMREDYILKTALLEKMPKDSIPPIGSLEDKYGYLAGQRKGFNQAISDMEKVIGKL